MNGEKSVKLAIIPVFNNDIFFIVRHYTIRAYNPSTRLRKIQPPYCAETDVYDNIAPMKTILLITSKESSVFRAIAESISIYSKKQGWAMHIITSGNVDEAIRTANSWNADGGIVYTAKPNGLRCLNEKWPMPTVMISPSETTSAMFTVAHDSYTTGNLAAHTLTKLGLDNFAFVADVPFLPWAEKRLETYRRTLSEYGRNVHVFQGGNLADWLLKLPKGCGLFAANDMTAEKVVAAAKIADIEVPHDLAVLGCDDDVRICEHSETTISSIRPDYPKGGMLAVQMLADAMEGRNTERIRMFGDIGVTHRASTRLTTYKSPDVSSALEYIRLNAFSGISASDVISRMKGSRRSAENMFRAATGHSILEEIQSVRLNEVKRLLANPLIKIGAIAAQTGYRSENFLVRLFKRETGMTPSQWRNSH